MTNLAITNTLANGDAPDASIWNTNYSDISTYINNRNTGATAWDGFKVSAQAVFFAGTVGAPGVAVTSGLSTGIYWPSTTSIAFSISGTNAMTIDASRNVLIGTVTQSTFVTIRKDQDATTDVSVINNNNTASASSLIYTSIGGSSAAHAYFRMDIGGGAVSWAIGASATNSNNLAIGRNTTSAVPTDNVALQITTNNGIYLGNGALATNATDGHLFIRTCAGTPSGTVVPGSGRAAIVYDTTGSKIWFSTGGGTWKGVAVA